MSADTSPTSTESREAPAVPSVPPVRVRVSPPAPSAGLGSSFTISAGQHVTANPRSLLLQGFGFSKVPRVPGRERDVLELINIVCDYNPDASRAVSNLIRLVNPGHAVEVRAAAATPMPDATARINELAGRVWHEGGGGMDNLITALVLTGCSEGGLGIEVEATDDLRDVADFYPFGSADIEFRYIKDPDTQKPRLAKFPARSLPGVDAQPLNEIQTKFMPLDPRKNDPYGRPLFLPAVKALLEMAALMAEHRDIMRIHGTGMRDISLNKAAAISSAPAWMHDPGESNATQLGAWLEAIRSQVEAAIAVLNPTDTFVHWDDMSIGTTQPGGRGAGMGIETLVADLSRQVTVSLKSMPILQGLTESTDATGATVQWQIYAKTVKALQHIIKRLLESAYNVALRIWGIAGTAHIEFDAIRETDRMLDASAETVELNNEREKFKLALIDQEEMGQTLTGHAPVGAPPPTYAEEFAATQNTPALASLAAASVAASTPSTLPASAPAPAANQPGTDAGISAEEGAALDQAAAQQ